MHSVVSWMNLEVKITILNISLSVASLQATGVLNTVQGSGDGRVIKHLPSIHSGSGTLSALKVNTLI